MLPNLLPKLLTFYQPGGYSQTARSRRAVEGGRLDKGEVGADLTRKVPKQGGYPPLKVISLAPVPRAGCAAQIECAHPSASRLSKEPERIALKVGMRN
jgi:hypothetical protein